MLDSSNRKIEIINIPINKLLLDQLNPRLAGDKEDATQKEILKRIYENEKLEELASSLSTHGFLPEEPIIVIPKRNGVFEEIKKENIENYEFIVIEGNRRVSSIKLLSDNKLNEEIIDDDFPVISDANVKKDLEKIPAIIYKERADLDAYLSIRHIAGNRKWDAYAKSKYIYSKVNDYYKHENISITNAINKIKTQIGDRTDVIRKLYVYYKIFDIMHHDIVNLKSKHIKERFSLIQVALGTGRTTISDYIGLVPFSRLNLENEIINANHLERLKDITKWIFGLKENDSDKVISDSRNIGKLLAPVLANQESTDFLKKYSDLFGAYELTGGEEELVQNSLRKAHKSLSIVQGKIRKYKDIEEIKQKIVDIEEMLEQIKILMNV